MKKIVFVTQIDKISNLTLQKFATLCIYCLFFLPTLLDWILIVSNSKYSITFYGQFHLPSETFVLVCTSFIARYKVLLFIDFIILRIENNFKLFAIYFIWQSLDEVHIEVETCEDLRRMSNSQGLSSFAGPAKYSFIHKVIDGITIAVNTVSVTFKSPAFTASVQVSQNETKHFLI